MERTPLKRISWLVSFKSEIKLNIDNRFQNPKYLNLLTIQIETNKQHIKRK
jgi:hypothetical protein